MSSDLAIRLNGVGKSYAIYERPHHRLLEFFLPNANGAWHRDFHALTDISLDVHKGETVGIVGRNGSGKSTLLQIICGTLSPSVGTVEVDGRIAALLELGAGFNAEFTGRENVYLYGTVLGLTRNEVERRFDEIAAFADIGSFIDQPVKSYSSGMYVRLAFAVAINVAPDILVVDEALSVGDEAFQRKCYARIDKMRDDGATVLFVSHSAGTVLELCDRAILLDRGECLAIGAPKSIVARYHKLLFSPPALAEAVRDEIRAEHTTHLLPQIEKPAIVAPLFAADFDPGLIPTSTVTYPGNGAEILDPHFENEDGQRVNLLRAGQTYCYVYRVRFMREAFAVRCGMLIKTLTGLELAGAVTAPAGAAIAMVAADSEMSVRFQFRCLLAPGVYFTNSGVLGAGSEQEEYLDRRVDVAMFRVLPDSGRIATAYVDLDMSAGVEFA